MAELLSSKNARKRHKPIEPPSPEIRHFSSDQHQEFRRNYFHPFDRQRSPQLSPDRASRHEEVNFNENGDDFAYQQKRAKASVFERLGGNVVSPPKRPNVCLNWMNNGSCPRGRQCNYSHPLPSEELNDFPPSDYSQRSRPPRQQFQEPAVPYNQGYQQQRRHDQYSIDDEDFAHRSSSSRIFSKSGPGEHGFQEDYETARRREREGGSHYDEKFASGDGHRDYWRLHPRRHSRERSYPASLGLPGNAEALDQDSAKLRSKVVVTKSKGSNSDHRHSPAVNPGREMCIPPENDIGGDLRESASEEALEMRLRLLQRQLKELDDDGGNHRRSESAAGSDKLGERRSHQHHGEHATASKKLDERNNSRAESLTSSKKSDNGRKRHHDGTVLPPKKLDDGRNHRRGGENSTSSKKLDDRRNHYRGVASKNSNDRRNQSEKLPAAKKPGGERRRHHGGSLSSSRKLNDGRSRDGRNHRGGSLSASKKSSSGAKRETTNGKDSKADALGMGAVDKAAAIKQLEPISDEEVEEENGEASSSGVATDSAAGQEADPSTSLQSKMKIDALDVEWAMPELKGLKSALSSRRRRFDLDYFLPTVGVCAEYLDEANTSSGAGEEAEAVAEAMKDYATTRRLRLLRDVHSPCPRASSARVDLKVRRQLCGLVSETDVPGQTLELNAPSSSQTFRKAFSIFEKWTKETDEPDDRTQHRVDSVDDEFRTT